MSKSITVHGLNDVLSKLIERRAKEEGRSLNKTIQSLLEEALGVRPAEDASRREDFAEFLNVWKASDLAEFERASADLRKVNDEDWR